MAAGFGVAIVVIVAAFFQDVLIAMARWLGRRTGTAVATRAPGVVARASKASRKVTTRVRAGTASVMRAVAEVKLPEAAVRRSKGADEGARDSVVRGIAGDDAADERIVAGDTIVTASRAGERARLDDEAVGRQPQYAPNSSIHLEESARGFLEQRNGSATVDALARHLDREFGRGRGIAMVEALSRRGTIVLQRDSRRQTRMIAYLRDRNGKQPDVRES